MKIEVPHIKDAFAEFSRFRDRVYASRPARWPTPVPLEVGIMSGESPFNEDRKIRPFLVREGGRILARVLAVMDIRYNRHWNEHLAHLCWFEALPGTYTAVQMLITTACSWLEAQGARAARAGAGLFELPFVTDTYESLPSPALRHNPPYYHSLLQSTGCEIENNYIDYKVAVTPELIIHLENLREATATGVYDILPLSSIPKDRRVRDFTTTFNETFKSHWGWSPYTELEVESLLESEKESGILNTSMLAYQENQPMGILLIIPEQSHAAVVKFPYQLGDSERLNSLAIGVREIARGHGVNAAMFSHGFLELARQGAKYLSFSTLASNGPSRRAAEKLGAFACSNAVVYRWNF